MIQFILIFLGLLSPDQKSNLISSQSPIFMQSNLSQGQSIEMEDGNGPGHGNGGNTGGNTGQLPPPQP